MPSTAQQGDTVAVHYTGKLRDGSVFDTSRNRDPLQFVLGESNVIRGFERAVSGMTPGDTKTADISAEEAYGPHQPELVVEFAREQIPPDLAVEIGQELQVQTTTGQPVPARVVQTSDDAITLDANHPLAGKELTFDIELVEVIAKAP
jgi:peptidylprolyl isomerase